MKTLYLLLLCLSIACKAFASDALRGCIVACSQWDETATAELYLAQIPLQGSAPAVQTVKTGINGNRGAVSIGGRLFTTGTEYLAGTLVRQHFTIYDESEWAVTTIGEIADKNLEIIDADYCAPTGTVYACIATGDGHYSWCILNPFSANYVSIKDLGADRYCGLAIDPNGKAYAIDSNGRLLSVDPVTGATSLIGHTGCVAQGRSSACYDNDAKRILLAFNGSLYSINPTTAVASKLYDLPNHEIVSGLHTPLRRNDAVPGRPKSFQADFNANALSGTVSFTMPSTLYGGATATGNATYSVYADGKEVAKGTAAYGAKVTANVAVASSGSHIFTILASNKTGDSLPLTSTVQVGPDRPRSPRFTRCEYVSGKVELAWEHPDYTLSGEAINTSAVGYHLTRSDGAAVDLPPGTSHYEDNVGGGDFNVYRYSLTADYYGNLSASVSSDYVGFGHLYPPLHCTFDSPSSLAGYKLVDYKNPLNSKPGLTEGYLTTGLGVAGQDSWVVSPAIRMEHGSEYSIRATFAVMPSKAEAVEIAICADTAISSLAQSIKISKTTIVEDWQSGGKTLAFAFSPQQSADYWLGFHSCGVANTQFLMIKDIVVEQNMHIDLPQPVTNLDAKIVGRNVELTYKFPQSNEALASHIYRDGVEIATTQAAAYIDIEPGEGSHTYGVRVANSAGFSEMVTVSITIDYALPQAPQCVVPWLIGDGESHGISWSRSPGADVTYTLYRYEGQNAVKFAEGLVDSVYVFAAFDMPKAEQTLATYAVLAVNHYGESPLAQVQLAAGKPYQLPFQEQFTAGRPQHLWHSGLNASAPDIHANGYAILTNAALQSGSIHVPASADDVVLSFLYSGGDIEPVVIGERGEISLGVFRPLPDGSWLKATCSLADFASQNVAIRFKVNGLSADYVRLAHITVDRQVDFDLEIAQVLAPRSVPVASQPEFSFIVANSGRKTVADYQVALLRGTYTVATFDGALLTPNSIAEITLRDSSLTPFQSEEQTYQIAIDYERDQKQCNDTSATLSVGLYPNNAPMPTDVRATRISAKEVALDWESPDFALMPHTLSTDDFESYSDSGIGSWLAVDIDDSPNPGSGKVASFVSLTVLNAYSANKVVASFAPTSGADDWLVSPLLSGEPHTISFCTLAQGGTCTFEVLASLADTDLANFHPLESYEQSSPTWQRRNIALPAGAKHFAVRHTSPFGAVLYIDDATMALATSPRQTLTHLGYNIYKNSELIATMPPTANRYALQEEGVNTYHITALYQTIESMPGEGATPASDRLEMPISDVQTSGPVTAYTLDGRICARAATPADLHLPPGIYIIAAPEAPPTRLIIK